MHQCWVGAHGCTEHISTIISEGIMHNDVSLLIINCHPLEIIIAKRSCGADVAKSLQRPWQSERMARETSDMAMATCFALLLPNVRSFTHSLCMVKGGNFSLSEVDALVMSSSGKTRVVASCDALLL